jgi:hypothetical protein
MIFEFIPIDQGSHRSVYGTDGPYFGRSGRLRSARSLKHQNVSIFRGIFLKKPIVRIFFRLKTTSFIKSIRKTYENYNCLRR